MIFYQMRGMTRLAEIATALPGARGLDATHGLAALGAGNSMQLLTAPHGSGDADSARLLGVIDRLERRIQELEHTAQGAPKSPVNSKKTASDEKIGGTAELLERAKMLEKSQRHAEALACCDQALAIEPTLTQAWLVKGAQLQALGREKEALRCYEAALQRHDSGGRTGA
jgi:tetratricopeptide (TPR) repeat protein